MAVTRNSRDEILAQVQRLMKLAESETATDGERNLAAARVAKIIAKHQIENAELRKVEKTGPSEIVSFTVEVSNSYGLGLVRCTALAWAVTRPLGGSTYRTSYKSAKLPVEMTIFLPEEVAELAKILLTSLTLQMESGLTRAAREHSEELDWSLSDSARASSVLRFRRGYLEGWGATVGRRVREAREAAVQEVRQEAQAEAYAHGADGAEIARIGAEITLVDDRARTENFRDTYYAKHNGGRTLKYKSAKYQVSSQGLQAGESDGRRADIGASRIGGSGPVLTR